MQIGINRDMAIQLSESRFWETMTNREIAEFQLMVRKLCMPFGVFHKALEKALGRPVWTHEMGLNWEGLLEELRGNRDKPTMEEIINLLPESIRIVVLSDSPHTDTLGNNAEPIKQYLVITGRISMVEAILSIILILCSVTLLSYILWIIRGRR